jgi:mono/diheme cytochrome c family protein
MNRVLNITAGFVLAAIALLSFIRAPSVSSAAPPTVTGDATRGAYIFSASAACGCHTTTNGLLAGGEKFEGPFGVVYAPNITQDPDTGIGKLTDQQIIDEMRLGKDDEGGMLFPIMPYAAFSGMSDQDLADLVAYLRTVPPIKHEMPEPALKFPAPPFTPRGPAPAVAPTEAGPRGAYLANNVSLCGDCHTPQKPDGSPDLTKMLAGGFNPDLGLVPNITPDNDTGIGHWTADQIATFLRTGQKPDGTQAKAAMAGAIQGGFKNLTDADAHAIASYLKTVPAVKNTPQAPAPQTAPATGGTGSGTSTLVVALILLGFALVLSGLAVRRSLARSSAV